jgi:arylsulfatase A-like enzyme
VQFFWFIKIFIIMDHRQKRIRIRFINFLIIILASFGMITSCSVRQNQDQDSKDQPNIVMILVDDLGYGDVGCYGGENIPTPNIDRLATEGVRFTDAHVMCSVCGPSRVALLTGRYQQRMGVYWNPDLWHQYTWGPPDSILLLPQVMKKAGYVTGHIGKWNITPEALPYVDECYDLMNWKGAYYPNDTGVYLGVDGPGFRIEPNGWGPPKPGVEYLTDRLTRHAIEFIENHQAEPFFLYLAYNAPHTPLQADIKYKEIFKDLKDEPNRVYAGMVSSIDENIGKILVKLAELDLDQNTMVVFTSDNGPANWRWYDLGWPEDWPLTLIGSAGMLRGYKAQRYEGGHREPFIIRWPAELKPGQVYTKTTSTLDLFPTFYSVTGVQIEENLYLDGVNLIPYIKGEKENAPHDTLFWMIHNQGAVRAGNWKLFIESDTSMQLYNLMEDLSERNDLAIQYPDIVKQLLDSWKDWNEPFPVSVSEQTKFTVK